MSIAIEVPYHDRFRTTVGRNGDTRTKRAGTIPEQYGQVVAVEVRHHEIRVAVAIEIGDSQGPWAHTDWYRDPGVEVAGPITQPDRHIVAGEVRDREVRLAIAIEIADRD